MEASPDNIQDSTGGVKLSLLAKWMHWYSWVILFISFLLLMVYVLTKSLASIIIGGSLALIIFPLVRFGMRNAELGKAVPALVVVTTTLWALAVAISARGPVAFIAALPLLLLPMILALPYISSRNLLWIAIGSIGICAVSTFLAFFGPTLPSSLSLKSLEMLMMPIIVISTGMATFGLWNVGSRLRSVLSTTLDMNQALAESERSLEQKVSERTAELEGALREISDIQEIAETVNTTLDLDHVMRAMMSTLQRVFKFDVLSIFLLDAEGKHLLIDRLAGFELTDEMRKRLPEAGFPMSEERSMIVKAVLTGKAQLAQGLSDESLPHMSPSDRLLYELNPVKSFLVCPLSIEGAVIGAVLFANKNESDPLDENKIDRIQRYVTPLSTVIRNARLYEETKAAQAEAVESSKAKSQFLANMSHELRTPLNAIIGYSEMLREEAEDAGQTENLTDLERISSSGHYLLELISGVLDLTKIEAGRMEMDLQQFDVSELLHEVVSTARPLTEKNSNKFEVRELNKLGNMHSDATKIHQALLNLLSNSSKFTDQGSIVLEAERRSEGKNDWLTFRVIDTGIGMAADQLERVFSPFTQADNSTSRKYGGTGLGLSITREFCKILGGSIEVKSTPGTGTTFTINLPATAPTPKDRPADSGA